MSKKKTETSVQIKVAIIGAMAIFLTAIVGLLQPIVSKWADIYFESSTPSDVLVSDPSAPSSDFIYDDFDNSAYNNSFNKYLWISTSESVGQKIQSNGVLRLSYDKTSENGAGLVASKYNHVALEAPTFFEAKLKVENTQNGHLYIFVGGSDLSYFTGCNIGYGDKSALFNCSYFDKKQNKFIYETEDKLVSYEEWHTARIEVDPDTMIYSYFLNGQKIGSFTQEAESQSIFFEVGIFVASDNNVNGYVDNIRIGKIK